MKLTVNILKNEKALVLLDQAIFSGTGFFSTLFLARILSPDNFGKYSGVILIIYLVLSLTNAIVIQPLQVSISKTENKNSYLTYTLILQVLLTFILSALFFTVSYLPGLYWLKQINLQVSILIFGFLLFDYFRKVYLATNNIIKALEIDFLNMAASATAFVLLHSRHTPGLHYTLWILSLAYLPAVIFAGFNFNFSKLTRKELRLFSLDQFSQGSWLILVAVLQWLSFNFFIMVSGIYLGIEALGAFRFIQSLFGVLNILLQTFENYVLPKVTGLYNSSVDNSKIYLRKITLQGFVLFSIILGLLSFFSKDVIIYSAGEKYSQYDYVIKLMSVLYMVIYLGYPLRLSIRMLVLNRSFFVGYLISFVFSLLSFHLLIKYGHLAGCVAGLVLNQLLMIFYWQYILTLKKFSLWK